MYRKDYNFLIVIAKNSISIQITKIMIVMIFKIIRKKQKEQIKKISLMDKTNRKEIIFNLRDVNTKFNILKNLIKKQENAVKIFKLNNNNKIIIVNKMLTFFNEGMKNK